MAFKTVQINLADLELEPIGAGTAVTGEVWAEYSHELRTTDGKTIPRLRKVEVVPASGVVEFEVIPNDDPSIPVDLQGFAVTVGWSLTYRGGNGRPVRVNEYGRSILVTSADSDPVNFAAKTPVEPVPPQFTTVEQLVDDVEAAEASAAASATSAQAAQVAAEDAASLVGAPADTAMATILGNPASESATTLNATFGQRWKPNTAYAAGDKVITPSGFAAVRRTAGTSGANFDGTNWIIGKQPADNIPTVKPLGDGRPGVWEMTHDDTAGYLFHLLAGANFGGSAAILAIGNDNGTGTSILLPNKAGGRAIVGDQRATVTATNAHWMHATQRSPGSSLVRLEMQANDAATVLELLAFGAPGATQNLLYVGDPSGEAGVVRAASGEVIWKRNITVHDKNGSTVSYINVTDNTGVPANTRTHTLIKKAGPEYYGYSGSAGQWWPFAVQVGGSRLKIQAGGMTSTVGTPGTLTNLIEFQNGKIGFFNAAPVAKPTGVAVDAAAIHAALVTLGLISA